MNRVKKIAKKNRLQTRNKAATADRLLTRMSSVRVKTADDEQRSIEAVLATEAPVEIDDWTLGRVTEILLIAGARHGDSVPLLDTHNRYSVHDVLGSTREIRAEAGDPKRLIGRNFYADTTDAQDAYRKARDGHLTDCSVGYRVLQSTIIPKGERATVKGQSYQAPATMALRIATAWEIKENSVCPIGADGNAKHRNANPHTQELTAMLTEAQKQHIINKGFDLATLDERQCSALLADFTARTEPQAPPAGDADSQRHSQATDAVEAAQRLRDEGAVAEQKRQDTIRKLAGDNIADELVQRAITGGWSIDKAQGEFYTHVVAQRSTETIPGAPAIHVHNSELSVRTLEAGLLLRAGGMDDMVAKEFGAQTAEVAGREYRDLTLLDICRYALALENQPVRMNKTDLIRAALSTISLPQILGDVAHKALLKGYAATQATWRQWCSEGTVTDFKAHRRFRLTDVGELESLLPSGEFAHGTLDEEYESITAETKGKQLVISRSTFINDDLGILTKVPQGMGIKAMQGLTKMVYTHFLGNPTMSDTVALFHATHSNLNTTTPLAAAGLNTALKAFAAQTDKDGESIDIAPKFLLAPPDLSATAKALLQSDLLIATGSTDATVPNSNIHKGILEPIFENRLSNSNYTGYSTADWYLIGDPATCDTVEVAYLNGRREPHLERYTNTPGLLGLILEIYFDAGVKAMDHRGVQKNDAA